MTTDKRTIQLCSCCYSGQPQVDEEVRQALSGVVPTVPAEDVTPRRITRGLRVLMLRATSASATTQHQPDLDQPGIWRRGQLGRNVSK